MSDGCRRCLTRRGPSLGDDASFGTTVVVVAFVTSRSILDDSDGNVVVEPSDSFDEGSRSKDSSVSSCSNTMSMCATVYFDVWTSSVKGSRNETLFGGGKKDLDMLTDILRYSVRGIGLLISADFKPCGCV